MIMCKKKIQASDDKLYEMLFELSLLASPSFSRFLTTLFFEDCDYLVVF